MRLLAGVALLFIACCLACPAQNAQGAAHKATGNVIGSAYCADTNTPARRALIVLVPTTGQDAPRMLATTTDMEGRFAINEVPEGSYYVSTLLAGYLNPLPSLQASRLAKLTDAERKELESRAIKVTVTAEETASLSVRLERAAEIEGTVQYDDGSPAINLPVEVLLKSEIGQKPAAQRSYASFTDYAVQALRNTDDHGRFRLLGLAPGEYVVDVQVPTTTFSYGTNRSTLITMVTHGAQNGELHVYYGDSMRASTAKPIKIADGEAYGGADITIPLSKLHTIRGHVTMKSTGQPPASASMELLYADTREPARFTVALNGDFEFAYVPEGSFVLQAAENKKLSFLAGDADDNEVLGKFLSMGPDPIDSQFSSNAEIGLDVHGDLDNVSIAVPDPAQAQAPAAAQSAAPQ